MAKPPTVGSKTLTPHLIASLKWDDPKLRQCPKIGSYPLQLRDADLLLLRVDLPHARPNAHPSDAPLPQKASASRAAPASRHSKLPPHTVLGGAPSREAAIRIRTCYDAPASSPSAAPAASAAEGSAAAPSVAPPPAPAPAASASASSSIAPHRMSGGGPAAAAN